MRYKKRSPRWRKNIKGELENVILALKSANSKYPNVEDFREWHKELKLGL